LKPNMLKAVLGKRLVSSLERDELVTLDAIE
jgi:hypothetical protein